MIYLLNWRLWAAVAFLALLPFLYIKGRSDGAKLERVAVAAAQSKATDEARALERRRQDRADEAGRLAAAREAGLAADAARARDAASGLRDATDLAERVAQESESARQQVTRTLGIVVNECGARLTEVAGAADAATSEAVQLRQAWPR